jgi:stage II sporulation protein GA (sporulation sigma-E factor processing peptidase)
MLLFEVNPSKLILKANHFVGLYPIKISIIAGVFGIVIFTIFAKLFKKNFLEKNIVYKIEIGYLERKVQLNVLLDSGNLLKAPISNEDVIIVEKKSLKDLLSLDILKNINNIINGKWIDNNVSNDNYEANGTNEERKGSNNIYEKRNDDNEENSIDEKRNIRLIPFSSLGNENGVLFGFKPDYVKIYADEEKMQKNVIVGVYNGKLTKTNLYSGLIGLNLLEGESKHEFIKSA